MKESKLISVIVPIYNVENYLRRCVDSIINQTYKNLEIILVDDGSPDNCGEICDEYKKVDSRIVVIHKRNGGLSDARNTGLEIMHGEYVIFIDSDDYFEDNAIEVMLDMAEKQNADLVIADIRSINENGEILNEGKGQYTFQNGRIFSPEEAAKIFAQLDWGAWNKLYKKNVHEKIYFPKGKIHEDEAIMFEIFHQCHKIVYTNYRLYNYLKREGSITGVGYSLKKMDWFEAWVNNLKYVQKYFPESEKMVMKKLVMVAIYNLDNLLKIQSLEREKAISLIRKELSCRERAIILNQFIKINYKIRIILENISLELYCKLFKIKEKE